MEIVCKYCMYILLGIVLILIILGINSIISRKYEIADLILALLKAAGKNERSKMIIGKDFYIDPPHNTLGLIWETRFIIDSSQYSVMIEGADYENVQVRNILKYINDNLEYFEICCDKEYNPYVIVIRRV